MITQLRGRVTHKDPEYLILDVGGVGYCVHVTPETLANTPDDGDVTLWTHLVVRETALDLYGFRTREELHFFALLIGVSGVGPKSGIAILGLADVATLTDAITQGDTTYLTKVSGIGAKNAKKIVLELGDKLGARGDGASLKADADVVDALAAMGYSAQEARTALKHIPADVVGASERLKHALKHLAS